MVLYTLNEELQKLLWCDKQQKSKGAKAKESS